jgi:hypothetical protein
VPQLKGGKNKMKQEELEEILEMHIDWLYGVEGGKRADLRNVDLRNAKLCNADLQGANLCDVDLRNAKLRNVDLRNAKLRNVDLQSASLYDAKLRKVDLHYANLYDADLRGANIDFSCWPLWCGSFNVKVDDRIMAQLINHILSLDHPLARKLRKLKTVTSLSDLHPQSKKGWMD